MNSISLKSPEYFHREYTNDVDSKLEDPIVLSQCKRVARIAMPFLSLYKPAGFALSLGMGSCRAISDISSLYQTVRSGNQTELLDQLLRTAVSIASVACTIIAHPLGMVITTIQDIAISSFALAHHIQKEEYQQALENAAIIVNNVLYLCMFVGGGIELSIASLATQMLLGLYNSRKEFLNKNYPEALGHLAMAMIRGKQMLGQVHALQLRWEKQAQIEAQQVADLKKMAATIEALQKQLAEETAKLEALQQTTSAEINDASELLEHQKTQLIDLQQKLLDTQRLQDILVSYGNNPEYIPAFHYAIKKGDKEAVELMIKHGADVNTRGYREISATTIAILESQADIVRLLLDNGSNANASIGYLGLEGLGNKPSLIHLAASVGNVDIIQFLLERGANINENAYGDSLNKWTPLHVAAEKRNLEAVKFLIKSGADINAGLKEAYAGFNGSRLPLDAAIGNLQYDDKDNPDILDLVKFLIDNGAKALHQRCNCPEIWNYVISQKQVWRHP